MQEQEDKGQSGFGLSPLGGRRKTGALSDLFPSAIQSILVAPLAPLPTSSVNRRIVTVRPSRRAVTRKALN